MTGRFLAFKVLWDEEAKVFHTECDEICGIVAEAETVEELRENLLKIIPEALELEHAVSVKETAPASSQSRRLLRFRVA